MTRISIVGVAAAVMLTFAPPTYADVITFSTDPFAGSTALTTPGRQVVGGEPSIAFNIGTDVFAFVSSVFGVGDQVDFVNALAPAIPSTDVNVVVLQTLDNDGDASTPFAAGTAANLIAAQITSSGAGFFIYFNSGLNLPRLVYSTDLSDNTADLKILARLTNLTGQPGSLLSFEATNFDFIERQVPEPSSLLLIALAGAAFHRRRRQNSTTAPKR